MAKTECSQCGNLILHGDRLFVCIEGRLFAEPGEGIKLTNVHRNEAVVFCQACLEEDEALSQSRRQHIPFEPVTFGDE